MIVFSLLFYPSAGTSMGLSDSPASVTQILVPEGSELLVTWPFEDRAVALSFTTTLR